MRALQRFVLIVPAIAVPAAAASAQAASAIDRAGWLAGCWELRAANRVTMEMWMPPLGGQMFGASRTVVGSAVREFELLRLTARGDTLVYSANPSGQRETDFRSVSATATELVFENLAHDFPQRVIYRRRGTDSVVARIEGPGANNTTRGVDFPMRRASCTTPPAPPPPPETLVMDAVPSPNGRQMLIAKGAGGNLDVFIASADGAGERRLTDHAAVDYQPAWSPDGSLIAFVSTREGHQEIYTMRPDGSGLAQLTRGTTHNSQPAWSPDGRLIAYQSEQAGRVQVYVMNADGSSPRALTSDTTGGGSPSWSPDGTRLLFVSNRTRRSEIYVMNRDGSGQRQLTESAPGHSGSPSWSPDGRLIAFWTSRDGNDEAYVMNADGGNQRNVTNHPGRDFVLGWTTDGTSLLFRSARDRTMFDIYRIRLDGSQVTRLTTTANAP